MTLQTPARSSVEQNVLTFRELTLSDIPRIALLAGDWEVARMTGRISYPYNEAAAVQWIEDLLPGEMVRAIIIDEQLIGICGYAPDEQDKTSAEIGYWIGKPFWGHGYATQAGRWLIERAFKKNKFNRLTGGHFIDNPASGRVLEKLGFAVIGPCHCWSEARACNVDALIYELHAPKSYWRWS